MAILWKSVTMVYRCCSSSVSSAFPGLTDRLTLMPASSAAAASAQNEHRLVSPGKDPHPKSTYSVYT